MDCGCAPVDTGIVGAAAAPPVPVVVDADDVDCSHNAPHMDLVRKRGAWHNSHGVVMFVDHAAHRAAVPPGAAYLPLRHAGACPVDRPHTAGAPFGHGPSCWRHRRPRRLHCP